MAAEVSDHKDPLVTLLLLFVKPWLRVLLVFFFGLVTVGFVT